MNNTPFKKEGTREVVAHGVNDCKAATDGKPKQSSKNHFSKIDIAQASL